MATRSPDPLSEQASHTMSKFVCATLDWKWLSVGACLPLDRVTESAVGQSPPILAGLQLISLFRENASPFTLTGVFGMAFPIMENCQKPTELGGVIN